MADQGAQIAGEVLAAIRLELNQRIIPALSDPDALHSAKMAEDILSHLSGWILFGRDISDEVVADFREMADETATTQFIDDYLLPSGPLGTFREPLQDAIEAGNTGLLKPAAAAERKMFAAEARAIDRATDEAETRLEASERVVGPALATAFLEAVLGPGHRVAAVSRAPGGYSKDTLFFAGIAPDGSELPLVIRRDLPFGPGETTVVDEFHLIEGLADAGFPVARVITRNQPCVPLRFTSFLASPPCWPCPAARPPHPLTNTTPGNSWTPPQSVIGHLIKSPPCRS